MFPSTTAFYVQDMLQQLRHCDCKWLKINLRFERVTLDIVGLTNSLIQNQYQNKYVAIMRNRHLYYEGGGNIHPPRNMIVSSKNFQIFLLRFVPSCNELISKSGVKPVHNGKFIIRRNIDYSVKENIFSLLYW